MNNSNNANNIERKIRNCTSEEEKARELIKQFSIATLPVTIVNICTKLGFKVFQDEIKEDIHAYILVDNGLKEKFDTSKIIVVNIKDNFMRRRFSVAHELGHYFINYNPSSSSPYFNAFEMSHNSLDPNEKKADYFAACLMMPEKQFSDKYKELSKKGKLDFFEIVDKLSQLFAVPPASVEKRIVDELKLNKD